MSRRVVVILMVALALRLAYVALQPRYDPTFGRPILDGAYYTTAAHALASGGGNADVYYMPPLYTWLLAGFFRLFGDAWGLLFVLQQIEVVAAAGLLAWVSGKAAGEVAAAWTAGLALLYHPALFFASRPVGESLALLLLALSLACATSVGARAASAAGGISGLLALLRPNFLPLPVLWGGGELARRQAHRAGLLLASLAIVLLPVMAHNYAASGHLVPVSANGGVVFWLGNAPGALGVYTPASGFTGSLVTQQQEAIAEASARSGRSLDPIEADGFWWRAGLRARVADPWGTLKLLGRRILLCMDNAEHGLDYAPALDTNPLRFAAPLPFAALLGLAVFGLFALGFSRTGGFPTWSAIAVGAAAPLLFYVSSRHRLPVAFLLAIPGGAAMAALSGPRRLAASLAGISACALSLAIPSGDVMRQERASALSAIADAQFKAGEIERAAETARSATETDAANAHAWFNRGVIEAARGDRHAAEQAYRAALAADASDADAAGNLAGLLVVSGRAAEAPAALEKALESWPRHTVGWTNLVVAYAASGESDKALDAARRAAARGVVLDPGLVETVEKRSKR